MSINEIVSEYMEAKAARIAAERREKAALACILDAAGNKTAFDTDDYSIIINYSESCRLDTKALYKDFPDIKETYGKKTVSKSVAVARKEPETPAAPAA